MTKIGRNEKCPCGSGKKYKKCHGAQSLISPTLPAHIINNAIKENEAKQARRIDQQGKGKPIVSAEIGNDRLTVIGDTLLFTRNQHTFVDVLDSYIRTILDPKWFAAEMSKQPNSKHIILQWHGKVVDLRKQHVDDPENKIHSFPKTGAAHAYYNLAYNLYLLKHNAELQSRLIKRLKDGDFHSAYYETYVAAWFTLAGFEIRIENEEDSLTTHPEFIATKDAEIFSVEAKCREAGKQHYTIANQLVKALKKETQNTRVIFIDMNVGTSADLNQLKEDVIKTISTKNTNLVIKGNPAPSAFVFVTNQPFHLALDETSFYRVCLDVGFKIDDFGYDAKFASLTEAYKARKKYSSLYEVQGWFRKYDIPMTFDGEIPEFAFGKAERRFTIGNKIEVQPGIYMTIEQGCVLENEKCAYLGVYSDAGSRHIITAAITDAELSAYKSHPETFFGQTLQISKNIQDPVEFFEFIVNSYKKTPRKKLLEFMGLSNEAYEIGLLTDEELLFFYAEGLTRKTFSKDK